MGIVDAVKDGMRAIVYGTGQIAASCARSYGRGLSAHYNFFQGKAAANLGSSEYSDLNIPEKLIHSSISAAWLFALLGSIVSNSYRSLNVHFLWLSRLITHSDEKDFFARPQRRGNFFAQYIMGFPGLLLGLAFGSISFSVIVISRVLSNSVKTLALGILLGASHAWGFEPKQEDLPEPNPWFANVLGLALGLFGYTLAFALTATARIVKNSWETFWILALKGGRSLLAGEDKYQLPQESRTNKLEIYLGGFIGTIAGLAVGFAAMIVLGVLVNSYHSARKAGSKVLDKMLGRVSTQPTESPRDNQVTLAKRNAFHQYVLGFPGLLIGAGIGFTLGLIRNLGYMLKTAFALSKYLAAVVLQLSLHSDESDEWLKPTLEIAPRPSYGWGILGILPGLVIGILATILSWPVRFLTNNWTSLKNWTKYIRDFAYDSREVSLDKRHPFRKVLGIPGLLVGILLGAIVFAAIKVKAYTKQSRLSFLMVFSAIIKQVLAPKTQDEKDVQFVEDNEKLFSPDIYNSGSSQEDVLLDVQATNDPRSFKEKYIYGGPGALFGFIAAIPPALFILARRTLLNSYKSARRLAAAMTWLVLWNEDFEDKVVPQLKDRRTNSEKYGFGSLGLIFGALMGIPLLIVLSTGRLLKNSFITMLFVAGQMLHKVLHDNQKKDLKPSLEDKRESKASKFAYGSLGLPLGLVLGLLVASFAVLARVVNNSIKTSYVLAVYISTRVLKKKDRNALFGAIKTVENQSENASEERPIKEQPPAVYRNSLEDNRSMFEQYILGFTGIILGAIFGGLGAGYIFIGRVFWNSYNMALQVSFKLFNRVTEIPYKLPSSPNAEETWTKDQKYLWGGLGIPVGIAVGIAVSLLVVFARILLNSFRSLRDFGGGFLNLAFERKSFDALSNETTNVKRYGWGLIGVVLAVGILAPVALAIYILRKVLPLVIGLATIWASAMVRLISEGYKYVAGKRRFSNEPGQDTVKGKLKQLFANLTSMGNFEEGALISNAVTGSRYTQGFWQNLFKFLRKSITLNTQTLTENFLSKVVESLESSDGTTENLEMALGKAAQQLSAKWEDNCVLITPESEKRERKESLNKLRKFIKDFAKGEQKPNTVPTLYTRNRTIDLFFGQESKAIQQASPAAAASAP